MFAVSCNSVKDATEKGNFFFDSFIEKDYDSMVDLVNDTGLDASPRESWIQYFKDTNAQYGDLKSYKKTGFNIETKNEQTVIELTYSLKFEDKNIEAKIELVKEGNGDLGLQYCKFI